jgi:hypothetical protein
VSAQRRLAAAGISEGQTVGLNIAHPIDQLILICALYRLRAASASINAALDAYLDHVPLAHRRKARPQPRLGVPRDMLSGGGAAAGDQNDIARA